MSISLYFFHVIWTILNFSLNFKDIYGEKVDEFYPFFLHKYFYMIMFIYLFFMCFWLVVHADEGLEPKAPTIIKTVECNVLLAIISFAYISFSARTIRVIQCTNFFHIYIYIYIYIYTSKTSFMGTYNVSHVYGVSPLQCSQKKVLAYIICKTCVWIHIS